MLNCIDQSGIIRKILMQKVLCDVSSKKPWKSRVFSGPRLCARSRRVNRASDEAFGSVPMSDGQRDQVIVSSHLRKTDQGDSYPLASGPSGIFVKSRRFNPIRTPFTTRPRRARIFRIATNFHAAIDDTIMDVGPPLVRPRCRRASGG
jgi:hypothetical protein